MSVPSTSILDIAPAATAPHRPLGRDERIYHDIRAAVMDHRLPPGTKLPEATLSTLFGVSRPIVRKALGRLAHEHIVCIRPNRSALVATPSVEETRQVFEARRVVESAIIRSVVRSAGTPQIQSLDALLDAQRDAHERGERRHWVRLSGQFHLRMAEIGANTVLAQFLNQLVSRTSLMIALYQAPGGTACAFEEHAGLIAALHARDEARAVALMNEHLCNCEARLDLEDHAASIDLAELFAG